MENTDAPGVRGELGERRASGRGRDSPDAHFFFADEGIHLVPPPPIQQCPPNLEWLNPLPHSLHSAMSNPPPAGWDLGRFSQLEERIQVVETGLKQVQEDTKKILRILESGN